MYQFYEKKLMYAITASICMTPYAPHMTSHPLFMKTHHFIYDVKSTMSNISSSLSDLTSDRHHTIPVSLKSHTLSLRHIHNIWHHTQCYDNTPIMEFHSHYIWHHTHCICVITRCGSSSSNPVYVWHHSLYVYDIMCTTADITSTI